MVLFRLAARWDAWEARLTFWESGFQSTKCLEKSGGDWAGKTAQSVKYMSCQYEDLRSIPRNPYEKAGHSGTHL